MARKKTDDSDFIDEQPAPAEPVAGLVELDPEKEALLRRVAELEAQAAKGQELEGVVSRLEALLAAKGRAYDTPFGESGEYWTVKLQYVRDHVVKAPDPANAWATYCQEMSVIASEFRPEIVPADRQAYHLAQARRFNKKPEEYRLPDEVSV